MCAGGVAYAHSQTHTGTHKNRQTDRQTKHTDKAVVLSGSVWPDHSRKGSLFSESIVWAYVRMYVAMYMHTHVCSMYSVHQGGPAQV